MAETFEDLLSTGSVSQGLVKMDFIKWNFFKVLKNRVTRPIQKHIRIIIVR